MPEHNNNPSRGGKEPFQVTVFNISSHIVEKSIFAIYLHYTSFLCLPIFNCICALSPAYFNYSRDFSSVIKTCLPLTVQKLSRFQREQKDGTRHLTSGSCTFENFQNYLYSRLCDLFYSIFIKKLRASYFL